MPLSLLEDYLTEDELAAELKAKTGIGTKRVLRKWRTQRVGPPWAKFKQIIVYPTNGFEEWLRSLVQQPARSRKRAAA
jgi:hypothetical protein